MADETANAPVAQNPDVSEPAADAAAGKIQEAPVYDSTDEFVNEFVRDYGAVVAAENGSKAKAPADPADDWDAAPPAQRPAAPRSPQSIEEAFLAQDTQGELAQADEQPKGPARDPETGRFAKPTAEQPSAPASPANPFEAFGLDQRGAIDAATLYHQRDAIKQSFESLQKQLAEAREEARTASQRAYLESQQKKALAALRRKDPVAFDAYVASPAFDAAIDDEAPEQPPHQGQVYSAEDIKRLVNEGISSQFQQMQLEQATRSFFDTANTDIERGFDEKDFANPFAARLLRTMTASQIEMDRLEKRLDPTKGASPVKQAAANYIAANRKAFDEMIEAEVARRLKANTTATKRIAPAPTKGVTGMPQPSERFTKFVGAPTDDFAKTAGDMLAHLTGGWNQ